MTKWNLFLSAIAIAQIAAGILLLTYCAHSVGWNDAQTIYRTDKL